MRKFEYDFTIVRSSALIREAMNDYSCDGWEVTQITPTDEPAWWIYFRREVNPPMTGQAIDASSLQADTKAFREVLEYFVYRLENWKPSDNVGFSGEMMERARRLTGK